MQILIKVTGIKESRLDFFFFVSNYFCPDLNMKNASKNKMKIASLFFLEPLHCKNKSAKNSNSSLIYT